MATALRRGFLQLARRYSTSRNVLTENLRTNRNVFLGLACGGVTGSAISLYVILKKRNGVVNQPVYAKEHESAEQKEVRESTQTQRELRFLSFASVEYDGNVYMTPQDFLESVMEEVPRPRTGRTRLRKEEVDKALKMTTSRHRGNTKFFRTLHDQGIISYTEYLFLLCVLTKPRSGFGIAFNMFDTDGNQRVDKKEFLVLARIQACVEAASALRLEQMMAGSSSMVRALENTTLLDVFEQKEHIPKKLMLETEGIKYPGRRNIWDIISDRKSLENIITQSQKVDDQLRSNLARSRASLHDAEDNEPQDTTLMIHFFGRRGTEVLKYEDFSRFMENLQTEVLELEFNEFARGMPTITEEEFAKVLLRYTIFTKDEQEEYIERLRKRIPHVKGISFQDFKEFGQFLNNLDEFSIAMRMYTFADQPISEGEFKRAVKVCTGQSLNDHLVHTVFQLFDIDGDGHLSHKEFISIMKDRLHRGFKSHVIHTDRWSLFKSCVKNEMRNH